MSYWCDKQLTVTATRGNEQLEFRCDTPYARIGSHPRADVRLTGLPKMALYLHATSTGVFALPTALDGNRRPFCTAGWLEEETPVTCGDWQIEVGFADWSPMVAAVEPLDAPLRPGTLAPVLAVRHQNKPVARHRLRAPLSRIGRGRPSDLRLHTATVSSCHCIAYWDGRHIWVVDLCSTNGTRKDGQRFHAARLRRGRAITLGQIELQFESIDEVPERTASSSSRSSILLKQRPPHVDAPQNHPSPNDQPPAGESPHSSRVILERQLERLAAWESRVLAGERESARQMAEVRRQSAGLSNAQRKIRLLLESFHDYSQALLRERTLLDQRNAELDERMLELERRQNELDAFFASLANQEQNIRAAEEALAQEERLLRQREAELLQSQEEQQRAFSKREQEWNSLVDAIAEKEDLIQALQQRVESQQDEITQREERVANQQQQIQKLSEQLQELQVRLDDATQDRSNAIEEKEHQIEQLKQQLSQQQDEVTQREERIAKQQQQIQELVDEVGRLREATDELRQALRERELDWESRVEQWEQEKRAWIDDQRRREAEARKSLDERSQQLAEQASELAHAQQALAQTQREFEEQRRQWEQQRTGVEEELEARRSRLIEEVRKVQEERSELEALRREWETTSEARNAERADWERARAELETLRRELGEQRRRLQEERARLEAWAMEQSEALAAGMAPSPADASDPASPSDRQEDRPPSPDGTQREPLVDPQKVIENDPAFDQLTERLVEFGRKRKRRWLW